MSLKYITYGTLLMDALHDIRKSYVASLNNPAIAYEYWENIKSLYMVLVGHARKDIPDPMKIEAEIEALAETEKEKWKNKLESSRLVKHVYNYKARLLREKGYQLVQKIVDTLKKHELILYDADFTPDYG